MSNPIFFYGPPGSGKSALGRCLAQNLDLPFYDLDTEIQARSGLTIPQIFNEEGESGFRVREQSTLAALLTQDAPGGAAVIALGGGALLDPQVRRLVEGSGTVVCLHAPFELLRLRLQAGEEVRPLLASEGKAVTTGKLQNLLARRGEHYASFALQFDTSLAPPEALAWQLQVRLGLFRVSGMGAAYDVRVQPGGLSTAGEYFTLRRLGGPVALVCDENLARLHAQAVIASLEANGYKVRVVTIPAGEEHKINATVARLWEAFLAAGVDRSSTVAALGGGVVGDLAGFAAATFLRGVPWVMLPTSLLAMCDASLGGKTGVDLPQGKNLVGAFYPPRLVLVDPAVLATLPIAELRSGLAEVVKHGVINDPDLFTDCSHGWQALQADWSAVVRRAMAVKISVIQEDPFERGRRAVLNLGHTIGHAVELASDFRLRHGEAVAIGMVAEARLAGGLGIAQPDLADEIVAALQGLGLPTEIPSALDRRRILETVSVDKKRAGGKVLFALPVRIGEVKWGIEVDPQHLEASVA